MKVKFSNGTIKECSAPTEQKIFKNIEGETVASGWVLIFRLTGGITSDELDSIITSENVGSLTFLTENEEGEQIEAFKLENYGKISSSVIRHSEKVSATYADIQLSKGV